MNIKILKYILGIFKKPSVIEQSLNGYKYPLIEVKGDNEIHFRYVEPQEFSKWMFDAFGRTNFYTRVGDKIYFPRKSGFKKLYFK